MTRLLLIIFLISSIQCFSQKKEKRKIYDVNFENQIELNQLDFDNYLFGEIKIIKYEKCIYENGNEINGLTLNKLEKTHYDLNGTLQKIESYNTNRNLQFTILNFGKGFDFWINSKSNIKIDSISKIIRETDIENGNQINTYYLDSNYKVKSVDNIIRDSLKLYYFKTYDTKMLISQIHRNNSMFYIWDEYNRLKHYERRNNSKRFTPNLKVAPEYTVDFNFKNDTIFIDKKSENIITKHKLININGIILPIYEDNDIGTKTYFYNKDYSLYKMEYIFDDSSKIIYSYKVDSYGNWIQRFDNNKETYSRKLTYDKFGNWISSELKENGKKVEIVNREIIYY